MRKTKFFQILFLVGFWVLAAAFIITFEASTLKFRPTVSGMVYSFPRELLIGILVTIGAGTPIAAFEVLVLSRVLRRKPYGLTLVVKTAVYLTCIFVFVSLTVLMIYGFNLSRPFYHQEVLTRFVGYLSSIKVLMHFTYWGCIVLISLFVLQVSEKFGPGVMINFLLGKYHRPREERRIFMFMDLKSSTHYAETLGHIRYSQLIQDCFYDLTDVVTKHGAGIYQYVGDEAVLTWDIESGAKHGDCVALFYAFDETIRSKRELYEAKYGLVPEFKAGLNAGGVTVAEVGEIKKELAYHGDVLNTASRIQGKCNELGRRLLISEQLKGLIDGVSGYQFSSMGDVALKGKEKTVKIFDVMESVAV